MNSGADGSKPVLEIDGEAKIIEIKFACLADIEHTQGRNYTIELDWHRQSPGNRQMICRVNLDAIRYPDRALRQGM